MFSWQRIEVTLPYLQSLVLDDGSAPPLVSRRLALLLDKSSKVCRATTTPIRYLVAELQNRTELSLVMSQVEMPTSRQP